ncbi:MAG: hypothetical protein ACK5UQ_16225 [Planctomycetota bacterium]|jgi:hypothetical protein
MRRPFRLEPFVIRPTLTASLFLFVVACQGQPESGTTASNTAAANTAPANTPPASASATPANATTSPAAMLAADADCNLATPLVPGIPGSPGNLVKSQRNPNGDSELSVLMRQFVDDLREVRPMLEAGQKVKALLPVHRKMRCAWPTKPEERNQQFDLRAQAYLGAVAAFDQTPGKDTYNAIIAGCIACHSVSCGGPLEFIGEMRWE